jgi:hypothetical protein
LFNIDSDPVFRAPVKVTVPTVDGPVAETFSADFRLLDVDQFNGFDLSAPDGTRDFLVAAIVRLDEIVGRDGQPVPYDDGLRDRLLGKPHVRAALVRAYLKEVQAAAQGN